MGVKKTVGSDDREGSRHGLAHPGLEDEMAFWKKPKNKKNPGESGQSTIEYVLILAIVVMIASNMRRQLVAKINSSLSLIDRNMSQFESQE